MTTVIPEKLFDTREIVFCGINERGNIEVNWV